MSKYTLKDGESRSIAMAGILRIEAFEIGAGGAAVQLVIDGPGLDAVRVDDLSLIVHALPTEATVTVQPTGGTFGKRSEVCLTVSNSQDTVTFPRVLIDAAEDSPERLAEIRVIDGSYRLEAFGSSAGAGITDTAREVRSKIRRAELDDADLDTVTVILDSSASMQVSTSHETIEAAAKYIDALSDSFKNFRVTDGRESLGSHRVSEVQEFITKAVAAGADRVGQRRWKERPVAETSSLVIYVTDSPTTAMFESGIPTVVLILSPIGRDELTLAQLQGARPDVALAVIDGDVVQQLNSGANTELSRLTDQVTAMFKERN